MRRSYTKESKELLRDSYNGKHPRCAKKAKKDRKRLKTIANVQIRDLKRKMDDTQKTAYKDRLELYFRVANQNP